MLMDVLTITIGLGSIGVLLVITARFRPLTKLPPGQFPVGEAQTIDFGRRLDEVNTDLRRVESDIALRMERLEVGFKAFLEDADERIARGNKAWRRVAAAQAREESANSDDSLEEGGQLYAFDDGERAEEGMLPVPQDVEAGTPGGTPLEREKARRRARLGVR